MKFDFDKDIEKLDSVLAPILNANNPDLNPLKKLKGKILMYTVLPIRWFLTRMR
jgi:feruloyl esterase